MNWWVSGWPQCPGCASDRGAGAGCVEKSARLGAVSRQAPCRTRHPMPAVPPPLTSRSRLDNVDRRIWRSCGATMPPATARLPPSWGDRGHGAGAHQADGRGKQIRLTAVTNIDRFGDALLAYIWIEVERSDRTREGGADAGTNTELGFVGVMLGRSDILASPWCATQSTWRSSCTSASVSLPGVRRTQSTLG